MPRRKAVGEQAADLHRWEARCQVIDTLRADIAAALPNASEFVRARTLSELVLEAYLGTAWVDKNVTRTDDSRAVRPGMGAQYLRRDAEWNLVTAAEHYQRSTELARRLFEFEPESFHETLRTNLLHRDLEGAAFEAEVVRMLMALNVHILLRETTGRSGDDYDIDVWLETDLTWAIEAKTRAEESRYSSKSLLNTLRRARKQLPESALGSIFVKLPSGWIDDAMFIGEHEQVLSGFFGRTTRVHAVVFVWEQYTFEGGTSTGWTCIQGYSVHRSPSIDPWLSELLGHYERLWTQPFHIVAPNAPF